MADEAEFRSINHLLDKLTHAKTHIPFSFMKKSLPTANASVHFKSSIPWSVNYPFTDGTFGLIELFKSNNSMVFSFNGRKYNHKISLEQFVLDKLIKMQISHPDGNSEYGVRAQYIFNRDSSSVHFYKQRITAGENTQASITVLSRRLYVIYSSVFTRYTRFYDKEKVYILPQIYGVELAWIVPVFFASTATLFHHLYVDKYQINMSYQRGISQQRFTNTFIANINKKLSKRSNVNLQVVYNCGEAPNNAKLTFVTPYSVPDGMSLKYELSTDGIAGMDMMMQKPNFFFVGGVRVNVKNLVSDSRSSLFKLGCRLEWIHSEIIRKY